jgi:hypothetical protein
VHVDRAARLPAEGQRAANLGLALVNRETGELLEGAVSWEKET